MKETVSLPLSPQIEGMVPTGDKVGLEGIMDES